MNGIGWAIKEMQNGALVRRAGWNGKNQHIYIEDMLSHTIPGGAFKGERREYEPCVCLYNAQGKHQPGWVPSQGDLFAIDWEVVTP